MFEGMNAVSQCVGRIIVKYRTAHLENDIAIVIVLIYIMDGDPTFFFFCIDHSIMNEGPIHSFATEFRQERRVNIDDLSRISLKNGPRDLPEKTGEHDEFNFVFPE